MARCNGWMLWSTGVNSAKSDIGCVAGSFTRFLTQPLDVVKLRTQLQKKIHNPHRKWFKITRRILKEEGVTAFWLGHNLGQIHSVLALSCQFYVYEQATKLAASAGIDNKYKTLVNFTCGVASGCCGAVVVVPLEVIRVRQMLVKDQYKGLIKGATEVYKNGGFFAFYEGLWPSMLQMGPAVGLSFAVFSVVQPLILGMYSDCGGIICPSPSVHDASHVMLASSCAGIAAGLVSKTLTYPFDLAKRRMQIKVHSVVALSSQFYIYEQTTRLASKIEYEHKNKHAVNFLCGMIAGCVSSFLSVPLEVIRIHQIVFKDPRYKSIVSGAKVVYKHGGVRAFYEGFGASCLQIGPAVGISFTVFNLIQPLILNMTQTCGDTCVNLTGLGGAGHVVIASSCAGFMAGLVSKTVTYPMDLVKRRMQVRAHAARITQLNAVPSIRELVKCDSIFRCLQKYYSQEGFLGLYRGFKVTMYKAQMQTITSFTVYELICFVIRESVREMEKSPKKDGH